MTKPTTTLAKLRSHNPSPASWAKLIKTLGSDYGDDTPITLLQILDSNGLDDALWALRACDADKFSRLLACDYAERVLPLFEDKYPDDKRPRQAIEAARRYANGDATKEELKAAWTAAETAAGDCAGPAWAAAAAAGAVGGRAAWAASEAASNGAGAAAWDAARAAGAAWAAAGEADKAAEAAEEEWQEQYLRGLLND